jgi:hypothetical protein
MKSHFPSQIENKQISVPFYPFRALFEQTANEKLLHTLLTKLIIIRAICEIYDGAKKEKNMTSILLQRFTDPPPPYPTL